MTIGKTIRYLRAAQNISQGKLARELGVTPGYLSLLEHDKREPSLTFLNGVSRHFSIPVGFFLLPTTADGLKPKHKKLVNEIRGTLLDYLMSRDLEPPKSQRRKPSRLVK